MALLVTHQDSFPTLGDATVLVALALALWALLFITCPLTKSASAASAPNHARSPSLLVAAATHATFPARRKPSCSNESVRHAHVELVTHPTPPVRPRKNVSRYWKRSALLSTLPLLLLLWSLLPPTTTPKPLRNSLPPSKNGVPQHRL